jgi:large subunit ribosomal protein L15
VQIENERKRPLRLNQISPPPKSRQKKKRVGRGTGSGHGRYSCRGLKGQKSRSGARIPAWFEGGQMPLQRRVPKRGFRNRFRVEYQVVNLSDLSRISWDGDVSPETMLEKRLIRKKGVPVKILGQGDLDKPLRIRAHAFSKTAIKKIQSVSGTYEVI